MKIILDGGSFKNLEIDGTFSIKHLDSHTRLKISNIKTDENIATQIQRQLENQQAVIYMTTNLTYKFNCIVDDIQYAGCWIQCADYHDISVADSDQYITLTLVSTGLPSLEK